MEAAPPPWLHEAEGDPIDNSPYEEVSNTLGIPIFFLSEGAMHFVHRATASSD